MPDNDPYVIVKLPKELIDEVDKIVGSHGYKTRPEVIKDAVRAMLREYKRYEELSHRLDDEERPE